MANDNEDVLKANAGAPTADIPDLKKKEKEKKGAGASLAGRNVARAAASAANVAPAASTNGFLAGLTATLGGKIAVAAATALILGGSGMIGYSVIKGGGASTGAANLGGISDTLKVRAPGSDRIGVASKGEVHFDPAGASAQNQAPAKEEKKPEEAVASTAEDAAKENLAGKDKLEHNLSGSKLSSSLGGNFGGKNIFAGKDAGPKFDDKMSKINMPKLGLTKGANGQIATAKAGVYARASSRSVTRGKANRAIGQLRIAKGLSALGAGSSTAEEAASLSHDAFDQQQSHGGELASGAADLHSKPDDLSAPNSLNDTSGGNAATDAEIQSLMQQAAQLSDQATKMKKKAADMISQGMILIVTGTLTLLAGIIWLNGWLGLDPSGYGWYLIVLGASMMAGGTAMVAEGQQMKQQAEQMANQADQLNRRIGQLLHNRGN